MAPTSTRRPDISLVLTSIVDTLHDLPAGRAADELRLRLRFLVLELRAARVIPTDAVWNLVPPGARPRRRS